MRTAGAGLVLAWLAGGAPAAAGDIEFPPLQPYQIVRSLELVLDRIAGGDHAAMPMQRKLLDLADRSLRGADGAVFDEPRNLHALMVYAMSGGNPDTIARTFARLDLQGDDGAVARGVLAYVNGKPKDAMGALADVDPMRLPPDVGAFLALIKGSVLATEEPGQALKLLDQARLLNPGTLVEEAALRRTIAIGGNIRDGSRFVRAAQQYVSGYLRSPYASQFAEVFVNGAVSAYRTLDLAELAEVVAMMDPEQQQVIWLRIARKSAIEGLHDLSAFASAKAGGEPSKDEPVDPRAALYASLATVTSGTVEDVLAKLEGIDRAKLSAKDRKLLDAALTIAGELRTRPREHGGAEAADVPEAAAAQAPAASETRAGARPKPRVIRMSPQEPGPDAEAAVAEHEPAPEPETAELEPLPEQSPAEAAAEARPPDEAPAAAAREADPTELKLAETRRKLAEIDQLLGEAVE